MQAGWLAEAIKEMSPDVVFAGVQAANDLDGQIGPMLAAYLDMPFIGGVSDVTADDGKVVVNKEFAGGVGGKYEVSLPAVIGVQAAVKPPRYAPISKVRQIAQTAEIDELDPNGEADAGLNLRKMSPPVSTGHAEMFDGSAKEVAAKIVDLLKSKGLA